jgi:hypothetical protein
MTNLDEMIRIRAYELGERDNFRREPAAYWLEAESEITENVAPLETECCSDAALNSEVQPADGIARPSLSGHPAEAPLLSKRSPISFWPSFRSVVKALRNESDLVRATALACRPRR